MACFPACWSQQKISISTQHNRTHLNYIFKKQHEEGRDISLVFRFQKKKLPNAQLSIVTNVTVTSSSQHEEEWDYVQTTPEMVHFSGHTFQLCFLSVNQSTSFPSVTIFSINFTSNSLLEIPFASISYVPAEVEMSNSDYLFLFFSFLLLLLLLLFWAGQQKA